MVTVFFTDRERKDMNTDTKKVESETGVIDTGQEMTVATRIQKEPEDSLETHKEDGPAYI